VKRFGSEHAIGGAFAFALIGLFAVLSLLLVAIGTQAYRSVVNASDVNSDARCGVNYLLNRTRSCDINGGASIKNGALVLPSLLDGEEYEVYIYLYDGWLTEQFVGEGEEFAPECGEKLIEAETMELAEEGGLIRVRIGMASGDAETIHIARRSQG
jgi:hypothetical protein